MKRAAVLASLASMIMSSCVASKKEVEQDKESVHQTAEVIAETMVAVWLQQTKAANPTPTDIAPETTIAAPTSTENNTVLIAKTRRPRTLATGTGFVDRPRVRSTPSKSAFLIPSRQSCLTSEARVVASSVNVRIGPGAGRAGEDVYDLQSYLKRGECVIASAINAGHSWIRISNAPRIGANGGWVAVELFEFGDEHPVLEDLPMVAGPTQIPDPIPNVNVPKPIGVGYLGDGDYVCYAIQGSNANELAHEMAEKGPFLESSPTGRVRGLVSYRLSSVCYSDRVTGVLSDVKVSLSSTITVPCWYPPSGISPEEVTKFDGFMQLLAAHERRHIEIAWQYTSILEQRFRERKSCDETAMNKIFEHVSAELNNAQDAFHASPEGQSLPWP